MNKIIVEQNELCLAEEEVILDAFPSVFSLHIKGNVYCGIRGFSSKELSIYLEENSHLTIEILSRVKNTKNKIKIYNQENSTLDFHYACFFSDENELIIQNEISTSNNQNRILVRAVEEEGTLTVKAVGSIEEFTQNNEYLEDIKAITTHNNSVKIMPDLLVKTDSVLAAHNVAIAPIGEEELFYLKGKGLEEKDATILLKEGFLKGIIENEELKEGF